MSTLWTLVVDLTLPLPFILLTLMLAPLPSALRAAIVSGTNKILSFPTFMKAPLLHVMLTLSSACLAYAVSDVLNIAGMPTTPGTAPASAISAVYAKKWRAERNFWISAFALYLWVVLALVRNIVDENVQMQLREGRRHATKAAMDKGAQSHPPAGPHVVPPLTQPTAPPYPFEVGGKRYEATKSE